MEDLDRKTTWVLPGKQVLRLLAWQTAN